MKIIKIIILSFLVTVSSCKQAETAPAEPPTPMSTFDSPFPKNNKRLDNILGNLLTIKSGNDTLTLKITSTKNDNLIIDAKTGDTLFHGTVCKFRDLYYLNQKVNDTSYYISAIKIAGKLIYGLNDRWGQFYEVDGKIMAGKHKKLVIYFSRDSTVIRLHPDKKELKYMFSSIINTVVPDTVLNYDKSNLEVLETKALTELDSDENNNSLKVYPNPATDFINVELKNKNKSTFVLTDLNGRIILSGQLNEIINRIEVGNQRSGIYLLTVNNMEKKEKETVKIVIK